MEREEFLSERKLLNIEIKYLNEKKETLRKHYISKSKPCELDDYVEIVLTSGRKVTGKAKVFGILSDKNVHVTAYKKGAKTMYISTPNQSVNLIKR
jgi:hypothetical protein